MTWNRTEVDSVTQNVHCIIMLQNVRWTNLPYFVLISVWLKLRLCYSINDDVTLRFFWFKFTIFFRIRNGTNLTRHVWNFYCCFFCPVLVVTWCACRVFLFLFCSFLVNFTNLSWKEFNIILILIYWVD